MTIAARPLRSTWLPVALVVTALLYAALVPTLLRREPDRLHSEIAGIVEPARRLARMRQTSLAVEVSAYRAYVISGDPPLLDRVREARTRTEALGAQLATLTARLDRQTVEATAAVDRRIREWHTGATPRAGVDLSSYRPTLPALQDRFEASEAAAERLDVALSHEAALRARKADSLTVYHDLGNVAPPSRDDQARQRPHTEDTWMWRPGLATGRRSSSPSLWPPPWLLKSLEIAARSPGAGRRSGDRPVDAVT